MLFKNALLAAFTASVASAVPHNKRGPSGFDWGNEKIRGVNIGGWLVLEPWITPSIFERFPAEQGIIDEYTLTQSLGADVAVQTVLRQHWDTWATWADFKKIADSGFNVVRIPIGSWAFDNSNSPYAMGAAPYLDAAVDWARSVGLRIMIDLHGAPGSQNCFDNSGQKCASPLWQTGDNVQRTLAVLATIQAKYGAPWYDDVIAGIELLNEPLTPSLNLDQYKQFVRDGFGQQRDISQSRVVIVQDGFQQTSAYNGFLTPSDYNAQNVAVDHHEYQVFTPELNALQPWEHRQYVCNNAFVWNAGDKWTFIGEWSAAMTDCAKYLNGYGVGARYDGSYPGSWYIGQCADKNNIYAWSQQMKDDTRAYIEAQLDAFERWSEGWVFWTFKTEGSPEWDAFALIDNGIFPQPLTDRRFGTTCA